MFENIEEIEKRQRISQHRKKILAYINNESHLYIGYKNSTVKFDEKNNQIVFFDVNDYCHEFFEYIQEPLRYISYQDSLLYY